MNKTKTYAKVSARFLSFYYIACLAMPVLAHVRPSINAVHKQVLSIQSNVDKRVAKASKRGTKRIYQLSSGSANKWFGRRRRGGKTKNTGLMVALGHQPQVVTSPVRRPGLSGRDLYFNPANKFFNDRVNPEYIRQNAGALYLSPTPEAQPQQPEPINGVTVAALEAISQGRIRDAITIARDGTIHQTDAKSVEELKDALLDLPEDASQYGYLELRASSDQHFLLINDEPMTTTVPCGVIAHRGRHTVEILSRGGKKITFVVVIRAGSKVTVDVDPDNATWSIASDGNRYYTEETVFVPVGQKRDNSVTYNPAEIHLYVRPTSTTTYEWEILVNGTRIRGPYNTAGCIKITLLRRATVNVRIRCLSGDSEFRIYRGEGLCPTHSD